MKSQKIIFLALGLLLSWTFSIAQNQNQVGEWSNPIPFGIVPVAVANLPDGRLLCWSSQFRNTFITEGDGATFTEIFDPFQGSDGLALGEFTSNTNHDMFCPGINNLADGRILAAGGTSSEKTSIYDWQTGLWSVADEMNIPRGYQGNVTLSDGSVFTVGGSWSGGAWTNRDAEIWTETSGWSLLPNVRGDDFYTVNDAAGDSFQSLYRADNHIWLWAAPDGNLFHAGPSELMHWINTSGNGSMVSAGFRSNDDFSMKGTTVMFDIGKILKVGGAESYDDRDPANDNSYVIDINGGYGSTPTVTPTSNKVQFPRTMHNSTVLPNGEVLITGGLSESLVFTDGGARLTAEIFNPASNSWRSVAGMQTPRTYHSVAILMVDGRVFVGGGGLCPTPTQAGCVDHFDAEIYSPPYLFDGSGNLASRPVITAPDFASYNSTIGVTGTSGIQEFSLIRFSAATHSTNNEQRRIPVSFSSDGGNYQISIPNKNLLPPGYYMLFALNSNGVPSIAETIQIGEGGGNLPPVAVASSDVQSGDSPLVVNFTGGGSSDDVGIVSYSWDFGDGNGSTEADPQHTYVVAGNYVATLTVTDGGSLTDSATVPITVNATGGGNLPPVAEASSDVQSGDAPLAVSFTGSGSSDEVGIVSYSWDFGDGNVSSDADPQHTYTSAGNYTATLTVTDGGALTDSDTVPITVNATGGGGCPDALPNDDSSLALIQGGGFQGLDGFTGTSTETNGSPCGLSITNSDGGQPWSNYRIKIDLAAHGITAGDELFISLDGNSGSGVARMEVNLDNSPNSAVMAHTYGGGWSTHSGTVTVPSGTNSLDIWLYSNYNQSGSGGTAHYDNLVVTNLSAGGNLPPVAVATSDVQSGDAPLAVSFTGSGSTDDVGVVGYGWDFGDGNVSSDADPQHTYAVAGNYVATLTVTDGGSLTDSATVPITVSATGGGNLPPVAEASSDVQSGDAPLVVNFTGSGSSDDVGIVSYGWDFGDGNVSTEADPQHTYAVAGNYVATLTVTDGGSLTDSATVPITVNATGGGGCPDALPNDDSSLALIQGGGFQGLDGFTGTSTETNGSPCGLSITNSDGGQPWSNYRIKIDLAAHGITAGDELFISLDGNSGSGVARMEVNLDNSPNSAVMAHTYGIGWSTYSGTVTVPSGTNSLDLWLYSNYNQSGSGGTAHYDNLVVTNLSAGGNLPPVAVATSDVQSGDAPLAVSFTGSGSTDDVGVVGYGWDFGDGNVSSDADPQHTYAVAGNYVATLTVTDGGSLTDSATVPITVNATGGGNLPPVAEASSDVQSGDAPLAVSFTGSGSSDEVGIVSYSWDFGDGNVSSDADPQHTYTSAGNYTATLTVTDGGALTDSDTVPITVNATGGGGCPDALPNDDSSLALIQGGGFQGLDGFTGTSTETNGSPCGLSITNSDGGQPWSNYRIKIDLAAHGITAGDELFISLDGNSGSGVARMEVNLDNSPNSAVMAHTYGIGWSTYSGTVTVPSGTNSLDLWLYSNYNQSGSGGTAHYDNLVVTNLSAGGNLPPVAVATSDVQSGDAPLAVSFTGSGSTDDVGVVGYGWDFGDGNVSSDADPQHTYAVAGNYVATLTVTDGGSLTDSATVPITVSATGGGNLPPVAEASSDVQSGDAPLAVSFTGSGSSDEVGIVSYSWDFGDGNVSSDADPQHTYTVAGNYVATLTVTDGGSLTDSATVPITVSATGGGGCPDALPNDDSSLALIQGGGFQGLDGFTGTSTETNGSPCGLSITNSDGGQPWSNYRIKIDLAAHGITAGDELFISLDGNSGSGVARMEVNLDNSPNSAVMAHTYGIGWSTYSGTVTVPSGTNSLDLWLYSNYNQSGSGGTAHYDNLVVTNLSAGGNLPPVAVATSDVQSGDAPLAVSFTGSGSTDDVGVVGYGWDFGDGNVSSDADPQHTYAVAGNYVATLTVTDGGSLTDSATVLIDASGNSGGNIPPVNDNDLIVHLNFEANNGVLVSDDSGYNNDFTIIERDDFGNQVIANDHSWGANGVYGNALEMDGEFHTSNSILELPYNNIIDDIANQITISTWVWRDSGSIIPQTGLAANVSLFSHDYPAIFAGFHNWLVKYSIITTNGVSFCYGGHAPLNRWIHYAMTYDGQTVRLYSNGVEICNQPITGQLRLRNDISPNSNFAISGFYEHRTDLPVVSYGNQSGITDELDGRLDDFRIYRRALSESDIQAIYQQGLNTGTPGIADCSTPPIVPQYKIGANGNWVTGSNVVAPIGSQVFIRAQSYGQEYFITTSTYDGPTISSVNDTDMLTSEGAYQLDTFAYGFGEPGRNDGLFDTLNEGQYALTTSDGCSTVMNISVESSSLKTSLDDMNTAIPLDIILTPNPGNSVVQLYFPETIGSGSVSLFDINGRLLEIMKEGELKSPVEFNVDKYPDGVYLLLLEYGEEKIRKKLLIKR